MTLYDYINYMLKNTGLYGLFSLPHMGLTELLIQICEISTQELKGKPLVISGEYSSQQWLDKMEECGKSSDGVAVVYADGIFDDLPPNIKLYSPSLVIYQFPQNDGHADKDVVSRLKKFSSEYNIPIILSFYLSDRAWGWDLLYRKPELFDIALSWNKDNTLLEFKEAITSFTNIVVLHRNHDCDICNRIAYRYKNISHGAELSIFNPKRRGTYSVYFDFRCISGFSDNDMLYFD